MPTIAEHWAAGTFVALDFETSGLNAHESEPIEIGLAVYEEGKLVEVIESFLAVGSPLSDFIKNLTHITDELLADAPQFSDVFSDVHGLLDGQPLLAYNAPFDRKFLTRSVQRIGAAPPSYVLPDFRWIDPLVFARAAMPEHRTHKLGEVASRLGLSVAELHRAGDDARLAGDVALTLLERGHIPRDYALLCDKQEMFAGQQAVRRARGTAKAAVICDVCSESQPIRTGATKYDSAFYCSVTCSEFSEYLAHGAATPDTASEETTTATT